MNKIFSWNVDELFKLTPFHPQWFVFKNQKLTLKKVKLALQGIVLDIGCADCYLKKYLLKNTNYIGLDYLKTTTEMYHTTPTIYGDAHRLPIQNNSIDSIALLDVLEHLRKPDACIQELQRTLKPNGKLCIQVPFLYPIHDAPYDFQRWTYYGLVEILEKNNFDIQEIYPQGKISETFSLLASIGLAKIAIDSVKFSKIFITFIPLVSALILIFNITGLLLGMISRNRTFMPYGYLLICRKK